MKNRLLNICILCMVFPFFLQAADTHSVYNLRCEQEENPLGIETGQPCFSWQIQAQQRNFEQSAWQILVADSPEKLQAGNGNIWDSGKTLSSASILVPFKGKELKAGQTYYWKVRSWDKEDSPSRWSCIHTFGMGLLSEKDWSNAKWIALEKDRKDEIVTIGLHGQRGPGTQRQKDRYVPPPPIPKRIYGSKTGKTSDRLCLRTRTFRYVPEWREGG